ncbi:MAG: GAF domain-containing protein [Deltaproteobacteria bacterium]|nr:GAF domain-containing protein [Deltaproteobacteria bacterium]
MTFYSIPPLLTLCCFLGLAVLAIFYGPRTKTNLLFFTICILGSFLYIDILFAFNVTSAKTALWVSRTDHFFIVYLLPVYIHFFHTYLNISGRKWLIRGAYAYSFILMCLTLTPFYIESMQKHYFGYFAKAGSLYFFSGLAAFFVTLYVLIELVNAIRKETNSSHKNRLKYLFAGFGIMGLMNGLNVFPIYGYSVYPPGNLSFFPLIIFAVGLFKHDLLDTGIFIKKSLIYSILTASLTCLYALIIIIADKVFKNFNFSDSIYFPICFFLLIAFVFGPLKSKIQVVIDRIFYKGKYDYQKTIKRVSQLIVSVLDYEEIGKLLMDTIVDTMKVRHCALFLRDTSGSSFTHFSSRGELIDPGRSILINTDTPMIKVMKNHRQLFMRKNLKQKISASEIPDIVKDMDTLGAEIVLPMIFEENLNGFIVLGEKFSGDLFTREDMDLLETLAGQSSLAIENARSYKLLDDLNENLEKKVEERTIDLKHALSEKERTQEMLIRSESLAALGQLVAGVAHELNNPLTTVTSLVQATIEDIEQWDQQNPLDLDLIEDLKFADKELGRAKSIVASLLGLSRQTQTYSEAVSINSVVEDALRIMYNQYKHHGLEIVENYDRNLPEIQGNFANLGQVALNIIQNAIQSVIHSRGVIYLDTWFDPDKSRVVFSCKDTGPGVPESIRQDIFKPFFTTKEVGKGTGLGLYICHEIVRKHGGTLKLGHSDGPGAVFEVTLPIDGKS